MMDQYNADIAQEVLSKAYAELIKAQGYLVKADAPDFIQDRIGRQITAIRNIQDEISRLERFVLQKAK